MSLKRTIRSAIQNPIDWTLYDNPKNIDQTVYENSAEFAAFDNGSPFGKGAARDYWHNELNIHYPWVILENRDKVYINNYTQGWQVFIKYDLLTPKVLNYF